MFSGVYRVGNLEQVKLVQYNVQQYYVQWRVPRR